MMRVKRSDRPVLRRMVVQGIEVLLVLIIVGLLVATWLPALMGARPGSAR